MSLATRFSGTNTNSKVIFIKGENKTGIEELNQNIFTKEGKI